jgi:hypothetical protein
MSNHRDFVITIPTVRRTARWLNALLNLLVAVGVAAGLAWWLWEWAGQCMELLTCGLALVRPHTPSAAAANQDRLAALVTAAQKAGHDAGYCEGFRDGVRWGRLAHGALGMLLGAGLVAAMLNLGWLAGGAG